MSKTITIRLDDKLAEMLDLVAERRGRSKSEIMRDALSRTLSIELLGMAREKLVPRARELGLYTDEDVFRWMKRNPKTGILACLESESERGDSLEQDDVEFPSDADDRESPTRPRENAQRDDTLQG
jgi:predicted transcriptional regulator